MTVYIFRMPQPSCMIFATLQRRFVLNTSVNSTFIKFIITQNLLYVVMRSSSVHQPNFAASNRGRHLYLALAHILVVIAVVLTAAVCSWRLK